MASIISITHCFQGCQIIVKELETRHEQNEGLLLSGNHVSWSESAGIFIARSPNSQVVSNTLSDNYVGLQIENKSAPVNILENLASIIASAIPAASVRGTRTSALADRGVRGLRCHAEGPQVADTVIEAPRTLSFPYQLSKTSYNSTRHTHHPSPLFTR